MTKYMTRALETINWPQLVGTALTVLVPLGGYAISIENRLARIEERVASHSVAAGHQDSLNRLRSLEAERARDQQLSVEVLRRLDQIDAKLDRMSR